MNLLKQKKIKTVLAVILVISLVVLSAIICVGLLTSCGKDMPEIGNMDELFPQAMGVAYSDDFELIDEIEEKNGYDFDVKIYYATNRYSLSYKNKLLKKFGFKATDLSKYSDSDILEYEDGNRRLTIYTDSGHFGYREVSLARVDGEKITDHEEADRKCKEILNGYGLIREDCVQKGNAKISNGETVNTYGPTFVQTIDGIPMKSDGWVRAIVCADGTLVRIDDRTWDYEYLTTLKTISFEDAFKKITDKNSYVECAITDKLEKAVFTEAELVYLKSDVSDYIVSCFRFTGTASSQKKQIISMLTLLQLKTLKKSY